MGKRTNTCRCTIITSEASSPVKGRKKEKRTLVVWSGTVLASIGRRMFFFDRYGMDVWPDVWKFGWVERRWMAYSFLFSSFSFFFPAPTRIYICMYPCMGEERGYAMYRLCMWFNLLALRLCLEGTSVHLSLYIYIYLCIYIYNVTYGGNPYIQPL